MQSRLTVNPGRKGFMAANDMRGLGFTDILPAGANDCIPPKGDKKYTHIVYKAEDGVNNFTPSEDYRSPSDGWFWLCSGQNCYWDWDTGYKSKGSLMINRNSEDCELPDAAFWQRPYGLRSDTSKSSQWIYNRLPAEREYTIKTKVRTENVAGRVFIVLQYKTSNCPGDESDASLSKQAFASILSDKELSGTNDWTELTLNANLPPAPECSQVELLLFLEGTGKCWFDEVLVKQ